MSKNSGGKTPNIEDIYIRLPFVCIDILYTLAYLWLPQALLSARDLHFMLHNSSPWANNNTERLATECPHAHKPPCEIAAYALSLQWNRIRSLISDKERVWRLIGYRWSYNIPSMLYLSKYHEWLRIRKYQRWRFASVGRVQILNSHSSVCQNGIAY